MKYALIKNGMVDNVIIADYTSAQTIAQMQGYEKAVNVDHYPVGTGDLYEDGSFMNSIDVVDSNGNILIPARTVIERRMSDEEYIKILETKNVDLEGQIADLQIAMANMMGV